MKINYILVGIILIALGSVLAFGYRIYSVKSSEEKSATAQANSALDTKIESLQKDIAANPADIVSYVQLSQAYIQKVRETADTSYYEKIDELLTEAEKVSPDNPDVYAARASIALGRHQFAEGKRYVEKSIAIDDKNYYYYGLLGDAEIELGNYDEAVVAFQKMINIRPDFSSYSRISYIRELYGDIPGAKSAMSDAINAGTSFPENLAWAHFEMGKLEMRTSLEDAKRSFTTALQVYADYAPAYEGLGKVAYFENDIAQAETYFKKSFEALPVAQYAANLGDLYTSQGKQTEAKQYYLLAHIAFKNAVAGGTNSDLEESLFLSERDMELPWALTLAEKAYNERVTIYTADYLAWALYKNNQFEKAASYSSEALRLGENDPHILYHQGMVAFKNNDLDLAKRYLEKALVLNPHFSILGKKVAQDTLNKIHEKI